MAMATTSIHNTTIIRTIKPSNKHLFTGHPQSYLPLPRVPPSLPLICLARRRGNSPIQPNNKKDYKRDNDDEDDDEEEDDDDLGEELNEDDLDDDVVDAIFELFDDEDLAMLEEEAEEEEGEDGIDDSDDSDEDEDSVDDEEEPATIKGWQLRRLAYALKFGKRKVGIKDLAAELCLDRAVVLEMLRNPPPKLLMLSAALPDTPEPSVAVSDSETESSVLSDVPSTQSVASEELVNPEGEGKTPIHVLQGSWSANKRLKRVHLGTLQKVYRHSKRPTDAMISSIIQVTNLPRSRIIKWFEERRAADGMPEKRSPYIRPSSGQSESFSKVS